MALAVRTNVAGLHDTAVGRHPQARHGAGVVVQAEHGGREVLAAPVAFHLLKQRRPIVGQGLFEQIGRSGWCEREGVEIPVDHHPTEVVAVAGLGEEIEESRIETAIVAFGEKGFAPNGIFARMGLIVRPVERPAELVFLEVEERLVQLLGVRGAAVERPVAVEKRGQLRVDGEVVGGGSDLVEVVKQSEEQYGLMGCQTAVAVLAEAGEGFGVVGEGGIWLFHRRQGSYGSRDSITLGEKWIWRSRLPTN